MIIFIFLFFETLLEVLKFGLVLDEFVVEDALGVAGFFELNARKLGRFEVLGVGLVELLLEEGIGVLELAVFGEDLLVVEACGGQLFLERTVEEF